MDHGYVRVVDLMGDDLSPLEAARMSTGNETGADP
ncbi:MAG: thymidylate synthase (FAD), partial [Nitrososphaeria archaeon]|nr:thymidylate synthase (FAD) [Nitrososphaeria archaeon]